MATVVQERPVPQAVRALSTMDPPDYVDLFVAALPQSLRMTPELFARETIEGAPPLGRFLAWRAACRLRLEPAPSPEHIGGWRIDGRGDQWIRVQASSWFMTAQMVFVVEPAQASFATYIRYDRPIAASIWGVVSFGHRSVAPGFLGSAVSRARRKAASAADTGGPRP